MDLYPAELLGLLLLAVGNRGKNDSHSRKSQLLMLVACASLHDDDVDRRSSESFNMQ